LERVKAHLLSEPADVSPAWRAILDAEPHLLWADTYRRTSESSLRQLLTKLTCPPRSLEALSKRLSGPDAPANQPVRVWTLQTPYPADEIRAAEQMLELLAAASGKPVGCGFDVLATPKRGQDVFPDQTPRPGACGVYYVQDRYCAIAEGLSPEFRAEVLRHELVHAYCHTFAEDFHSSRFVGEGLAEYLRLAERTREGFVVPSERLAHNLARLDCMFEYLRSLGFPVRRLDPRALVRLKPWQFYSLGTLAYLIAQATMAYVGPDVIRAALAEGSDRGIVEAVQCMSWQDLLRFVARNGRAGDPDRALTVEDVMPDGVDEEWWRTRESCLLALRTLGVGAVEVENLDLRRLGPASGEGLGGANRLAEVFSVITDRRDDSPLRIVTDLSPAMDRRVVLDEAAARRLGMGKLRRTMTALEFVGRLEAALARLVPAWKLDLVGMGSRPGVVSAKVISPRAPYGVSGVADWACPTLRKDPCLVICVSDVPPHVRSTRRLDPRALVAEYVRVLSECDLAPRGVLVVDLAGYRGDALLIAHAFTRLRGPRGPVAYWNPQEQPR
jgi:hypothetical protein